MKPAIARGAFVLGLLVAGGSEGLIAREFTVADSAHLSAIDSARPGDVITLKDGVWRDVTLRVSHGGEADRPVLIKAETPGGVTLTGASSLVIEAPFVVVDGLLFQHGAPPKSEVIWLKSHHGIVRNTAVIDYNPPDRRTATHWVLFSGSYNRVERCYFKGKNNLHAVVQNGEPDCRYNSLSGSYFKDIPLIAKLNGREIVKILGTGHVNATTPDGAYFTLEGNLFEHADGEGVEVISLKSNFNQVLHNTLRASVGSLNIRRGNGNVIKNNVILGDGVKGAQGIRMSGERNLIQENFISGCDYGIAVSSGEYWAKALTPGYQVNDRDGSAENKARYPQNRLVAIVGNVTLDNTGADLDLGVREYKKHWPENQNILIPEECRVEANVFVRRHGGVSVIGMKPETSPPFDRFSFKPNTYAGNLLYGGKNSFAAAAGGFKEVGIPPEWSEAKTLAGFKPLTAADVGPDWIRLKGL